jgi:hypothetical protein
MSSSTTLGEVTPINPTLAIDTLLSRIPKESSPEVSSSRADDPPTAAGGGGGGGGGGGAAATKRRMPAAAAQARRRVSAELKHAHVKLHLLRAFAAQEGMRDRWSALARDGTLAKALRGNRQRFVDLKDDSDSERVEMLEMLEAAELESLR